MSDNTSTAVVKSTAGTSLAKQHTEREDTRKVLDEDLYTESLAYIIQRDYFPNLNKLRAQEEYLEALEKNDMGRLREITAKYARATQTPGAIGSHTPRMPFSTPAGAALGTPSMSGSATPSASGMKSETHSSADKELEERLRGAGIELDMQLDDFQAKYTSEDDASFSKLVGKHNRKHRERYHWLYEQQDRARPKTIEAGDSNMKAIESWDYKAKNTLMYYVEGAPLTENEKLKLADNTPKINYDVFKAPLPVFKPIKAGATSSANNFTSPSEVARFIQRQALQQGSLTPSAHTPAPPPESPRVGGYSFIPSTPSMVPGVDATPLMTWGTIEGTPLLLDPTMTPLRDGEPYFKLQAESKREQVANTLSENVAKKYRKRDSSTQGAMSPSLSRVAKSPRLAVGNLTPTAAKLLSKRMTGDDQLRASYSSPLRLSTAGKYTRLTPHSNTAAHSRTTSTRRSVAVSTTPATTTTTQPAPTSITDDLLNL